MIWTQCPEHDPTWRPEPQQVIDAAYELVNVWDEELLPPQSVMRESRIAGAVEDLRTALEPGCRCAEIAETIREQRLEAEGYRI